MFYFVKKQNQEKIKDRASLPCLVRLFELEVSFFMLSGFDAGRL